jgi:hypothetical protein
MTVALPLGNMMVGHRGPTLLPSPYPLPARVEGEIANHNPLVFRQQLAEHVMPVGRLAA